MTAFGGSLERGPDWFALMHVAYHRWGREHSEGHELAGAPGADQGVRFHWDRFLMAYAGAKTMSPKGNFVFLLPERDAPDQAGQVRIEAGDGPPRAITGVLEAIHWETAQDAERLELNAKDLEEQDGLQAAIDRTNALPPAIRHVIYFGAGQDSVDPQEPGAVALAAALAGLTPPDAATITVIGHTDCLGGAAANKALSKKRADSVVDQIVRPGLRAAGYDVASNGDGLARVQSDGLGETQPARIDERTGETIRRDRAGACPKAVDADRRVEILVQ